MAFVLLLAIFIWIQRQPSSVVKEAVRIEKGVPKPPGTVLSSSTSTWRAQGRRQDCGHLGIGSRSAFANDGRQA
jgi:hypothetical protein